MKKILKILKIPEMLEMLDNQDFPPLVLLSNLDHQSHRGKNPIPSLQTGLQRDLGQQCSCQRQPAGYAVSSAAEHLTLLELSWHQSISMVIDATVRELPEIGWYRLPSVEQLAAVVVDPQQQGDSNRAVTR